MKDMGWKTLAGTVLVGIGYGLKSMFAADSVLVGIGEALVTVGVLLGGYGVRSAIQKNGLGKK